MVLLRDVLLRVSNACRYCWYGDGEPYVLLFGTYRWHNNSTKISTALVWPITRHRFQLCKELDTRGTIKIQITTDTRLIPCE